MWHTLPIRNGERAVGGDTRIVFTTLFVLLICATSVYLLFPHSVDSVLPLSRSSNNNIEGCEGSSKVLGGVAGFYVFQNAWFNKGKFYLFMDDIHDIGTVPPSDAIFSGGLEVVVRPSSEMPIGGTCFEEESILMDDGVADLAGRRVKRANWEYHYYHFAAESLLGGMAALDLVSPHSSISGVGRLSGVDRPDNETQELADRWLLIPWENKWRDRYGLNEPVIDGLFGDRFVDKVNWGKLSRRGWIGFSKVVIVDRWASHRYNPLADEWNKMALPIFSLLSSTPSGPSIFSSYRAKFLDSLGLASPTRDHPGGAVASIPKIVYVDRQNSRRRLSDEGHENLRGALDSLSAEGRATVVHCKLGEMEYKDQIAAFADADILIGVHGNGLTHQLWTAAGGVLIEMFPDGVFLRDYQLMTQVLGHRHIAVVGSRMMPQAEWEETHGALSPSPIFEAYNPGIPLDRDFIAVLLIEVLDGMRE